MFLSYIIVTLNFALVKSELITITDENWSEIVEGEWMVEL